MLAFSLAVLIQVFYYLRYFRLLAFFRQKQELSAKEQAVSVIICARDEADQIEANLPGVLAQTYRSTHEIVVVNDNSQDDTKYLLEGLYRDFKQLHIVELKQEALHIPGKKFPLSMGIKSAKYELLLLTDADCIPASEHWILKMQAAFKEGIQIVLGYGAYKRKKGLLNRVIRFDTFHTALQYLSCAIAGQPYMGVGRNLAYKKELFYKQKGFAAHHQRLHATSLAPRAPMKPRAVRLTGNADDRVHWAPRMPPAGPWVQSRASAGSLPPWAANHQQPTKDAPSLRFAWTRSMQPMPPQPTNALANDWLQTGAQRHAQPGWYPSLPF